MSTPKDFPEDAHLENGNYYNTCFYCKAFFIGYKRRVCCKECEQKLICPPKDQTVTQQAQ